MDYPNTGYVLLHARKVREACQKLLTEIENTREERRKDLIELVLAQYQPGWIGRNIFRRKRMTTNEEALQYAANSGHMGLEWELWAIEAEGRMERELRRLRSAADVLVRDQPYENPKMAVSAKSASWLSVSM